MDPDANLREQRKLVKRILDAADLNFAPDPDDTARLAELSQSLDEWLRKGGFLPEDWKREQAGSDPYAVWIETTAYKGGR